MPSQPSTNPSLPQASELRRAGWFSVLVCLVALVGDGWSGRPGPLSHQILLLPVTVIFLVSVCFLLRPDPPDGPFTFQWAPRRALCVALLFQIIASVLFFYAAHHFVAFGYVLHPVPASVALAAALVFLAYVVLRHSVQPIWLFAATAVSYSAGLILAIASFPLNYLRSDMLPVILWADTNVLRGVNPYQTMLVGGRVYDFPYLPGMIVAYFPFVAAHLDIRFGSLAYLLATAGVIFWAARHDRRLEVAAVLAIFALNPFLQYRHDLYLQPHWLTLVAVYVLMQRSRFGWAAFIFGISMAIYQFSWILFPFFLLNALRRRGWAEAAKLARVAAAGALLVLGPFLSSALHRIANNTVSQWGMLPHALADPINLSYWATYIIRPDKLMRLQAALMLGIFGYCFFRNRCVTLVDTLRCSIAALTVFILFNSIVDGYFYLMLLVPMLAYTCVANDWWSKGSESSQVAVQAHICAQDRLKLCP